MSAYVYRCFDADGELLYIGCAFNPKRRIATHRSAKQTLASHALSVLLDRYEVEGPYATRAEAEAAEREAIQVEKPLFNVHHNDSAVHRVVRYLSDHDIPLEAIGLSRCVACDALLYHHMPPPLCFDCRVYAACDQLEEWLELLAS